VDDTAVRFDSLAVTPAQATLYVRLMPVHSLDLTIQAYRKNGSIIAAPGFAGYTSDNPSVATVSQFGRVTAVGEGTTTIAASLTWEGVTRTASMVVVVDEPTVGTVSVAPADTILVTVPTQKTQLNTLQFDTAGRRFLSQATYSSDAPAVATVDDAGVVTAVGAGSATLTASVTNGGATRAASTTVRVIAPTVINGVYDWTGVVDHFDPAWGDMMGDTYTATLRFEQNPLQTPGIAGTYTDMFLLGEEPAGPSSGTITSRIVNGRLFIDLVGSNGGGFTMTISDGAIEPVMRGTFSWSHYGGSFEAVRRPDQTEGGSTIFQ
jgi:hypothetical protein